MRLSAAARRKVRLFTFAWIFQVCFVLPGWLIFTAQAAAFPQSSSPNQGIITSILFDGNRRIQSDTLRSRIFSRVGDPYNSETSRRDFQALWNTQYFEDIRLEVEDDPKTPNGKILVFHVQERPIIRRIEYKGNKSVSESDILDRFKER
ncbi:MAG: POTRA domain-containing protein, partial [Candidatus Acidiferrales bacterium]